MGSLESDLSSGQALPWPQGVECALRHQRNSCTCVYLPRDTVVIQLNLDHQWRLCTFSLGEGIHTVEGQILLTLSVYVADLLRGRSLRPILRLTAPAHTL